MIWPPASENTIAAIIIGISSKPLLVADAPWTNCWYCGRNVMPPNIANPAMKPNDVASVKLAIPKSRSGMIGSAEDRSMSRKHTSPTAATPNRDRICQEPQGYWLPPQVIASTRELIHALSTPAPHQSILTLPWCLGSWERWSVDHTTNSDAIPSGRL